MTKELMTAKFSLSEKIKLIREEIVAYDPLLNFMIYFFLLLVQIF